MLRSAAIRFSWLAILLLLAATAGHSAPPETRPPEGLRDATPKVFALTRARIVVAPGRVIEQGTIVIRDGVLEAVGANVTPPAEARIIDASGRTIYPGLIDAFGETDAALAAGGAPYWNKHIAPQISVAASYQADAAQNAKLRRQGVTARLVAPKGGIIKGTSVVVSTGDAPARQSILRSDAALHMRLTVPFGRGRDEYPNSPMGAVALARQAMLDAQWYRAAWQACEADLTLPRPERNDALEVLRQYAGDKRLAILDAPNELFHLRADAFAREFALRIAVRGSGHEYKRLDAIAATGRTVLVPVNFPKPPNVATPEAAQEASLAEMMHWDLAPENAGRLDRAGVRIALISHGLSDAGTFLAQVREAVERGLDAESALRALTTTPAALCGVSDRLGSLEAGKSADLLITDGDLFDKKTKVLETWAAGERFEFQPPPWYDVRGTWKVKLTPPGGKPFTVTAKLTGGVGGPTGLFEFPKAKSDDKQQIKLERLAIRDARLSATFPSASLDAEGVARLSVVVSTPDDGPATWLGEVVWPDGSSTLLSAQREAKEDDDEQKPDESKKKDDKSDDDKDEGEAKRKAAASEKAGANSDAKSDAKSDAEDDAEDDADAEKNVEPSKAASASFAVNYPLGAFGRSAPPNRPSHVVFKNATVWTCGEAGVLEGASVLVVDGKIAAVGKDINIPNGAQVVDAAGMHLSPGIIDCHSHMATDGGVNESAQAITAEVRIGDFIDCDDITIYRQLAGGVTCASILHGSANPIGGQNQVIKFRWGALPDELKFARAPQGIKFALGENVKQSNWGERYTTRYPQSRMGVEQIIRDEFAAARSYRKQWDAWNKSHEGLPPRRDLQLDAMDEILRGKRWVHCHSYRQDEILALLRTLDAYGVTIGTFQHILEGYKVADEMARHGAMGSAFSDWWAYKFEVYDAIPYNGALMHDAGVVVSFNSDDRELARHLNHEAAKAVKYGGVTPGEALKFVTLNPARQLRIDEHVGSIEVGKDADLVLWSSSPLSTLSRCEQTWIDGRKYFDREEDQKLRDDVGRMRAALVQKILGSGQAMQKAGQGNGDDESHLWPRHDEFCHAHGHDH
ncbi:MAG: amidohydrolase family protein [Pirellulaceae bacterium]